MEIKEHVSHGVGDHGHDHDHEHEHQSSFWTKYVFSTDHKMIFPSSF